LVLTHSNLKRQKGLTTSIKVKKLKIYIYEYEKSHNIRQS